MINGYETNNSIFDKLHALPFTLYLTGSRFFGTNHASSDYDYFTQTSISTERELINLGFRRLSRSRYSDTLTNLVYRGTFQNVSIDVQLVLNVETKIKAQDILKSLGITDPSKQDWNIANTVAHYNRSAKVDKAIQDTPDIHKFSGKISAIKSVRQLGILANSDTSIISLKEAKDIVESIMALALREVK